MEKLFYLFALVFVVACSTSKQSQLTEVSIVGEQFLINGTPTYQGRTWNGYKIEGLLMNSRMVQGIFDDMNPKTVELFKYPDTQEWDAERNTKEFIKAMDSWKEHGMLAFTLNLQGGSPFGYGYKPVQNTAFDIDGSLRPAYMERLKRILDAANERQMVVILGYFYFQQDEVLKDVNAVYTATDTISKWLLENNYRNVLVEVANECDLTHYNHSILLRPHIHKLIKRIQDIRVNGRRLLVGTSFSGGTLPTDSIVEVSDFILLHGNGVEQPVYIAQMVETTRDMMKSGKKPIIFNEDDHYAFEKDSCNLTMAVASYASWGFFDYRRKGEGYNEGYQSVPVDWRISSERKKNFFNKIKEITGGIN